MGVLIPSELVPVTKEINGNYGDRDVERSGAVRLVAKAKMKKRLYHGYEGGLMEFLKGHPKMPMGEKKVISC